MANQVTVFKDVIKKHQRRGEEWLEREIKALQLLEDNFINEPKINHYPFPRLINSEICKEQHTPHSKRSGVCNILTMTYCGINGFHNLISKNRINNNIKPNNLYNTVECIINNLYNNRLIHRDITHKNICITENGEVSLIDFDRCSVNNCLKDAADYYKKPDLTYLKETLTRDFDALFARGRNRLDHILYKRFILKYKIQPWSMLYLI